MPNTPQTLRRYYSDAKRFSDGFMFPHVSVWDWSKSGFGALGPENVPRSMKLITFANAFVQHFNVPKISPQARAMEPRSCLWLHSSRALLSQCIWPQRSQWLKCCYWCTLMGRPQNARRIKSSRSPEATVFNTASNSCRLGWIFFSWHGLLLETVEFVGVPTSCGK